MERAADYDFPISNEELLGLCTQQDQEALRVLFRRHERPVYGLLYRMLSSREDAEEALADVFTKVWRGAAGFKGDCKFTTWLFRIASNTARDYLRSRRSRREVYVDDTFVSEMDAADHTASSIGDPVQSVILAQAKADIVQAMQELSEEDRMLISLYHFQELDYDEIVEITDIPAGNLKVKLFRARQRLKKLCKEREKDEGQNELRADTTESSGLQQGAAEWA